MQQCSQNWRQRNVGLFRNYVDGMRCQSCEFVLQSRKFWRAWLPDGGSEYAHIPWRWKRLRKWSPKLPRVPQEGRGAGAGVGVGMLRGDGDSFTWKWKNTLVPWFRGFLVSCFLGFRFFWFLSFLVSWLLRFIVSNLQSFIFPKSQSSKLQNSRIRFLPSVPFYCARTLAQRLCRDREWKMEDCFL